MPSASGRLSSGQCRSAAGRGAALGDQRHAPGLRGRSQQGQQLRLHFEYDARRALRDSGTKRTNCSVSPKPCSARTSSVLPRSARRASAAASGSPAAPWCAGAIRTAAGRACKSPSASSASARFRFAAARRDRAAKPDRTRATAGLCAPSARCALPKTQATRRRNCGSRPTARSKLRQRLSWRPIAASA